MKKILFCVFIFAATLFGQNKDEVIAEVGNDVITVGEFRKRFEMLPQLGRDQHADKQKLKEELLYTLIAEKLWAQEAVEKGLTNDDLITKTYNGIRNMYLRDALYRSEISEKVNITPGDAKEANFRNRFTLYTNFLYSENELEINRLYKRLQNGEAFENILKDREEALVQKEYYKVSYGQMAKEVEDELFAIIPGQYTKPYKSPEGWYIFKLVSVEERKIKDARDAKNFAKEVRKVLEDTKEDSVFNEFWQDFFKGREVETNAETFWVWADEFTKVVQQKRIKENVKPGEKLHLSGSDFLKIEKNLNDHLDDVLVPFRKNPVTLGRYIREFAIEGFYTIFNTSDTLAAQLNSRLKRFVEHELLTRDAEAKNLENHPEVKDDIDMWHDYYLSTLLQDNTMREVKITDDMIKEEYNEAINKQVSSAKVNFIEILVNDLETIEHIMHEMDNGADMRELAKKYTKRKWTIEKGGEFGFVPVNVYPELGSIAWELEPGEVYGPIETKDGYSIIKLIAKKESKNAETRPFDEAKEDIAKNLRYTKRENTLISKTIDYANKYGVTVNENVLKNVNVTNVNMFVYRYMGFGGRLTGVPVITPFTKWVKPWKEGVKVLP